ncbi:hypothetical protein [Micromonospora sp. A202]|nr:hypothetical protein [Micromonospora sp. A202]
MLYGSSSSISPERLRDYVMRWQRGATPARSSSRPPAPPDYPTPS